MNHVHDMTLPELERAVAALGGEPYRARQVWEWLYRKRAASWDAMTSLPSRLRDDLKASLAFGDCRLLQTVGEPGTTRKLLVALHDDEKIESVIIPAEGRVTVCVSSQVGCKFKCAFCASGQAGWRRNLAPGEIVGQYMLAWEAAAMKPGNVVFMGVGEPFDNYDNVLAAVRILNEPKGLAVGARRITISTCGVIPGIQRLAGEGLQVELSVSLHAPNDELRSHLMPANRRFQLLALIAACREYVEATSRIITFEYTLVRGVNDAEAHARQLVKLVAGVQCRVNLIPLSPVAEFAGAPSDAASARKFEKVLRAAGINTTLRASKGSNVAAACGQLRAGANCPASTSEIESPPE